MVLLFQSATVDPVAQTFSLNPTTVYGVLAGLLFLSVTLLAKQYLSIHEKLIQSKTDQINDLENQYNKLMEENKSLNTKLYEMGISNIQTLEKFGTLLETFLSENRNTQRDLLVNIRDLTKTIGESVTVTNTLLEKVRRT